MKSMSPNESIRQPENRSLLGIAIPTYQRPNEFNRLIHQLSGQILALAAQKQESICITILENPSKYTDEKLLFFREACFGLCGKRTVVHQFNIGGDANIEQAFSSQPDALYTWVLGDDEQILDGCMSNILRAIDQSKDIGLFLLRDSAFKVHKELLRDSAWESYAELVQHASKIQPNLLIAHSLISANIVRSELFCRRMSRHERLVIAPRHELPFCFAHLMGITAGLSRAPLGQAKVQLVNVPVLNTSSRAKSLEPIDGHQIYMQKLYRRHVMWLCSEYGVEYYAFACCSSDSYMLPPPLVLSRLVLHSLRTRLNLVVQFALKPVRTMRGILLRRLKH